MINKIRGLLAKAESTEHPAEAEAFLDKATALMAQYRIDEATLIASGEVQANPVEKRQIYVTGYRACKDTLIVHVVRAFNCHVIRTGGSKGYGLVGGKTDLDMAIALFTSLEIQLDRELFALQGYDTGTTRSMRANFAKGWVSTVGKRVTDRYAKQAEEAAAGASSSTALVLRDRDAEAADKFTEWYHTKPVYRTSRSSVTNGRHYNAGAAAGRNADVGGGKISGIRGAIGS
jgi:hypothetical protein